jgi:hypothetical protein
MTPDELRSRAERHNEGRGPGSSHGAGRARGGWPRQGTRASCSCGPAGGDRPQYQERRRPRNEWREEDLPEPSGSDSRFDECGDG